MTSLSIVKRKPILTIFYQFNPWQTSIGGIQTLIKSFIKYAPREFEVRLVGTGSSSEQTNLKWQEAEFSGREVHFLPLLTLENDDVRGRIPTTVKYSAALLGRKFNSDFMHFHRLEPSLAAIPWRSEKTLFIHNDIRTQIKATGDKKAILWRRFPGTYFAIESLLVRQFNQILSCNTDSAELYKQHYPSLAERVSYIKNSFDSEIFYPLGLSERKAKRRELALKLGLNEDTAFILFAGRLHPQKDPVLLVRSLAALNQPNVHLLIAGNGELRDEVQAEITQLGLSKQVTILGSVTQAELAELHRVSNVFVLTSVYEGLPLVVLEALASGTPIVTTRTGETPKFLTTDSGIVCEERTPESIADALRKVLLHPDDYPIKSCACPAQPYAASTVIREAYSDMWERYQKRCSQLVQLN